MTAGIEGDPGRAMAGSMAALSVTIACLNDQEWEATASQVGMGPSEREGMRCLLAQLSGPGKMAEAMIAAGEGDFTDLSKAGAECGLDMGPAPGQTPVRPPPTPTGEAPTPVYTPVPTRATPTGTPATPTPAPGADGRTSGPSGSSYPDHRHCSYSDRHPCIQPLPVEALGRRRRRLPGRSPGGPHRRVSGPRHLRDRPEVPGRDRPVVRRIYRGLF